MAAIDHGTLLDALPEAVLLGDESGRITFANPAASRLLGRPLDGLVGLPFSALWTTDPFDRSPIDERGMRSGRASAIRGDSSTIDLDLDLRRTADVDGSEVLVVSARPSSTTDDRGRAVAAHLLKATGRVASRLGRLADGGAASAEIVDALGSDGDVFLARIWLHDPGAGSLVLKASAVPSGDRAEAERIDPWSDPGLIALVGRSMTAYLRDRPEDDPYLDPRVVARDRIASVACIPLVDGGRLLGVLGYFGRSPLGEAGADALNAFAAVASATLRGADGPAPKGGDRHEAEAGRARLRAILDAIPLAVFVAEGEDGRLTMVNPAGAATGLGFDADSAGGDAGRSALLDDDGRELAPADRPLRRALGRGERVRQTLRLRGPDGSERVVDVTAVPIPGPVPGAVSIYHDVTDRVRLEAELAERAGMLRALLDHLPVGVIYFDARGAARASNDAARSILGYPRHRAGFGDVRAEALLGGNPALREALGQCLGAREPRAEASVPWERPDGGRLVLDWRFEPLEPDSAAAIGAIAILVDVTESARTQAELHEAMKAAEAASRNKTRFLSAVSHDLRTPVNAISLLAELLGHLVDDRSVPADELAALAVDIKQAASSLIELLNDLLDLARLDAGATEVRRESFGIDGWLDSTLKPLEHAARGKGLALSWRSAPAARLVRGDRVKMGRVLTNLVGNALKFTAEGSVEVVAAVDGEGGLALSVADTGPGIPEDQRERIFDEFSQLQNPERDRNKGTGLGLSICRRLVSAVGGSLTVERRAEGGSIFTARYPPDHLPPAVDPVESRSAAPGPPATLDGPILLVEDDPSGRNALARLLRRAGFEVEAVADGPAGLESLDARRPSLILLDLMMPGMDGVEFLGVLRRRPDGGSIPVVILSGMSDHPGDPAILGPPNVSGRLAKPVDLNALLEVVRGLSPGRE